MKPERHQPAEKTPGARRVLRGTLRLALLGSLFVMMISCSGQYKGMPRAELLTYQTHATYGGLYELSVAYAEAINAAVKEDTLHPGMYADYGVTLALMGHKGTACRMLNAEMRAFPESRGMVTRLKRHLMPEMLDDTLAQLRDTANMAQLLGWAYDSVTAGMVLPVVAPVVDSSDTAWLRRQTPVDSLEREIRLSANQKRELLEKQQREALMARQAHADSVAAAKQAKVDARKQAQADKQKEKKQKEKDKKQKDKEKKKLDKQKQKARKQAAAEKKREQEQAAAAKQKQREAEAAEKQAQREQAAAAKKAQREEEALAKKAQREQEAAERKAQREREAAERKAQREQEKNNAKGGEE